MKLFCLNLHESHRTVLGDAGDWTQDLIHAKHALYHWATSPVKKSPFCFCRFSKSFNSKSTAQTCNMFPQICMKHYKLSLEMLGIEPRTSYMQSMHSTSELHPLFKKSPFCFCRFTNTTNPVVVNYQEKSEIISHENHCTFLGDAGDWTLDLIHEKEALYHWATSPLNESLFCFCRFRNTINPVVGNYQDISEIILHESHRTVLGDTNTINPVVGNYQDISEIILLKFAWKS